MKTSPLSLIVERIRSEQQLAREVPDFDPQNGNETARFLFVLEAPGPKAVTSGFISLGNKDQTAKSLQAQLTTLRSTSLPSVAGRFAIKPRSAPDLERSAQPRRSSK